MGRIISRYIMPHPPFIVPGIGRGREVEAIKTIEALEKAAKEIASEKPDTIIISSPHAPCFRDYVYISDQEELAGDFSAFGDRETRMVFKNNLELAELIADIAGNSGINAGGLSIRLKERYGIGDALDHGALVPLYFISRELKDFKLVHISTPFMTLPELHEFGKCVEEAVSALSGDVVYIASGDLSHRLTEDAPAGYDEAGKEYDEFIVHKLSEGDVEGVLNIDTEFMEKAGECGTRSIAMMLGTFSDRKIIAHIYSYEGPCGVGYLVARIVGDGDEYYESDHVKLARESLETFIKDNRKMDAPKWLGDEFHNSRAGVFVSLKLKGRLRGCIGTIIPTKENIAEEIISNAISSGTLDPRFSAVVEEELPYLKYSVDILGKAEKISSLEELDVKKYGVIVTSGYKRGLLLPDIRGVNSVTEQVRIALGKAGISESESFELEKFEVLRYK